MLAVSFKNKGEKKRSEVKTGLRISNTLIFQVSQTIISPTAR